MFIEIDAGRREPIQQQIYAGIRRAIRDGVLAPGARLPSSRALAADLGIARLTAVLAFERLIAEGYIQSRPGAGMFVNRELPDDEPLTAANARKIHARHPGLSHRGREMAQTPRIIRKIGGPPRAFRIGVPALDKFPTALWNRLVSRRARSLTAGQLEYGHAAGLPALRAAIADHVNRSRGTRCSADQVIVVAGAQQGLDMVARLLLDVGDVAWTEEPGYPGAHAALVAAGARIEYAPVDAEGLVIESQRPAPRLIYTTPSHQFPLGVPMSLRRREQLLQYAGRVDAWIIEDDYDTEFRFRLRPTPCLHGLDPDGRVIYIGSFSKTLFPALRLGYLIVPADIQSQMVSARLSSDIHPHDIVQAALADFILEGHFERHLRRMSTLYRERLSALQDAMHRYCGDALVLRPVANGLHAVADLHVGDDESLFREAAQRGVETMPLSAYYLSQAHAAQNGLVLGFGGVPPRVITESVKRLAAAIDADQPSVERLTLSHSRI